MLRSDASGFVFPRLFAPVVVSLVVWGFPLGAAAQSLWLAESFADSCDFELALGSWDGAPVKERQTFEGRLLRARLLIQLDRGAEAVKELTALRGVTPPKRMADVLLALALAQSSARLFADAERSVKAAREKGADVDLVEAAQGELLLSMGRVAEAEAVLRQVLRRSPTLTGPLWNLAVLRAREGNAVEAAALIRLAWQLGAQDPKALRRSPDFARVRALGLLEDFLATPVGHCAGY